jgi:hypothetical protein
MLPTFLQDFCVFNKPVLLCSVVTASQEDYTSLYFVYFLHSPYFFTFNFFSDRLLRSFNIFLWFDKFSFPELENWAV